MDKVVLAVDAGGTSVKYGLLEENTWSFLTGQRFYDMPSIGTSVEFLSVFARMFADAARQCGSLGGEIARVAFCVPGPFDCAAGISRMEHKWPALKDLPLREAFREMDIFPETVEYSFLHDVHAFLAGEKFFGPAKDYGNTLAVIIGTGLGLGLWEDGALRFAEGGGPLYSIFRRPMGAGILEDYVSGRGISAGYAERTGRMLSARETADAARGGDRAAKAAYEHMGAVLGENISDILKRHAIECVVVGGRVSCAFDLFGEALCRAAGGKIRIYASGMLESAAMLGAAVWGKSVGKRPA